eukprot:CAMPEP_0113279658 /NCGR_PEP_ID=MMETSP0008_2-20120614/27305_1 /TAXON_ID=97485 /ORGANISM="Prymnesium parvum" /LENGTH=848 /DNA_ID=CAMNT_0000129863 /DNA_START=26 /DNA_END=2570 /DNA_ORIENTATION=- /assembly_acc=CAM_ASM_000153
MQPCSRVGDDSMQHSAPLCAPTTDSLPEANTTTSKGVPSMPIEPNTSAAVVPLSAAPAASVTIAQLQEMALSLGCVVTPIKKWAKAIAHAIASSLRTREGDFIYQSASIRMPEVPRAAVMQILPEPKSSSASQITWEWEYLFMHYELRMPLPLIHRLVQAACKQFDRKLGMYHSKVLLYHPWVAKLTLKVPRLAPSRPKLYPVICSFRDKLGVQSSEDGALAFRDVSLVLQELVQRDAGKLGMPSLADLLTKREKVPVVFMLDATGFHQQQLNTIAIRNPQASASSQQLHFLGLGNCGDDRSGSASLLGPNLSRTNSLIANPHLPIGNGEVDLDIYFCMDVAAVRHCEHIVCSGWCACSRDFALRQTPKAKPSTVDELHALLNKCKCHSSCERYTLSHSPLPGETIPLPCPTPGCTFAHNRDLAAQELAELLAEERRLAADDTKKGKATFSAWRLKHAHSHSNIPPGCYGRPMFDHHFDQQILDALHLGALGLPKTPWKHGVLNNASDDARVEIGNYLKSISHPLDTRRKDDNRSRAQKWFTGERWLSFCAGERGSPGGPQAIAQIVKIIADDLEARGACRGSAPAVEAIVVVNDDFATPSSAAITGPAKTTQGKGTGRAAFTQRAMAKRAAPSASTALIATTPEVVHVPTQIERSSSDEALRIIRARHGSRSQTLINTLLAFDAYFAWWYPFKESIPLRAPQEQRLSRALDNCRLAIDMHEIFERIAINNHGSYLPHGAIYKVSRDILRVGDVWAFGTSPLELQNADTKRDVASDVGARNIKFGKRTVNATTMSLSTFQHVLTAQHLRSGEGELKMLDSRRRERVFGSEGSGRLTAYKPKMERENPS